MKLPAPKYRRQHLLAGSPQLENSPFDQLVQRYQREQSQGRMEGRDPAGRLENRQDSKLEAKFQSDFISLSELSELERTSPPLQQEEPLQQLGSQAVSKQAQVKVYSTILSYEAQQKAKKSITSDKIDPEKAKQFKER